MVLLEAAHDDILKAGCQFINPQELGYGPEHQCLAFGDHELGSVQALQDLFEVGGLNGSSIYPEVSSDIELSAARVLRVHPLLEEIGVHPQIRTVQVVARLVVVHHLDVAVWVVIEKSLDLGVNGGDCQPHLLFLLHNYYSRFKSKYSHLRCIRRPIRNFILSIRARISY